MGVTDLLRSISYLSRSHIQPVTHAIEVSTATCKYELHVLAVRAGSSIKPQISSANNAACNSNSNVTYISYHADRHEQLEEGDIASFFGQGLRTGASAENVSRPITGLQSGQ